jgi:Spy/CpxP family protein refolding chaperone
VRKAKRIMTKCILSLAACGWCGVSSAVAQDRVAPPAGQGQAAETVEEKRPRAELETLFKNVYESRLIVRALGLTDDQLIRMRAVHRQFGPTLSGLRRDTQLRRVALDEAMFGADADAAQVDRLAKELSEAEARVLQMRTRMQFQIRQILTPEQLKTFNELRVEAREGIRERLKRRPRALP